MATVVSTGQITIIDSNDAKPITAFITSNISTQQLYSPDTGVTYIPDYTSSALILSANVYIGSITNDVALLTNVKWSNTVGGISIGATATLTISTNQNPAIPSTQYYFEGTYTDPITGYATKVLASTNISIVKTGSNATYVMMNGLDSIKTATGITKNSAYMTAALYRGSLEDTTITGYKWYKWVSNAWVQIYDLNPTLKVGALEVSGLYGFSITAVPGSIGALIPATAALPTFQGKTISISELAIDSMNIFKVVLTDGADSYERSFTITDIEDPYVVSVVSTKGDKFTNGAGDTDLYPRVYANGARVVDLTGWTFNWTFSDKDGNQSAFIDEASTTVVSGLPISANTAGAGGTVTLSVANANLVANAVVKLVKDSSAKFFEIASVVGAATATPVVTLKAANTLVATAFSTPAVTLNEFQGGTLYICKVTETTSGGLLETAAKLNVTQYEIDTKGTIFCEASRP